MRSPGTYHHPCAEQEAVHRLGDVSRVDLVVVRVLVFPVACLQGLQETHQKHSGNLEEEGGHGELSRIYRNGSNEQVHCPLEDSMTQGESRGDSQLNLGSYPSSMACWLCDLGQVTCLPVPWLLNCRMKIIPPTWNLMR